MFTATSLDNPHALPETETHTRGLRVSRNLAAGVSFGTCKFARHKHKSVRIPKVMAEEWFSLPFIWLVLRQPLPLRCR